MSDFANNLRKEYESLFYGPTTEHIETAFDHIEQLEASCEDLLFALRLILPLAKGYVAANNVGGNQGKIEAAESAIAKAEG